MAGSIRNNGSAWGQRTSVGYSGNWTCGCWVRVGSGQYASGTQFEYLFEVGDATYNYHWQIYTDNVANTLEFYSPENNAVVIASGSPVGWYYVRFVKSSATAFACEVSAAGSSSWTTVATSTVTNANVTNWNIFRAIVDAGTCTDGYVRSWRFHSTALSQADSLLEKNSTTPVNTANLYANFADGATPNASTWYQDGSGNARHLTLTGTAVADSDDPIAAGGITLVGQSAGIATARGVLGNLWVLSGQSLGLAATVGAFVPAPSQSLTGQSSGIAANAGALANQGAQALGGQAASIATQVGVIGNGDTLAGAVASIATNAGNLGPSGAQAVTGQAAGIAAQVGTLGNLWALTGAQAGIAVAAGSPGVSDAQSLAGQLASIAATAGTIASSDVVLGRSAGISTQAGSLGPSGAEPVTGQVLGIAVSAGALGVADAQALTGYSASIAASAGSVGASQSGGSNPTGQSLGISAQAGALGASDAYVLAGAVASIAVSIGNLGGGQVVSGQQLGISIAAGNLGPATALPMLGRFVGIATVAGSIAQPGESVTRALTGLALGIGAYANALTWVDYGPPVDYAYTQSKIEWNDAVYQFAISGVWRSKATADSSIPLTFPYRSQLNAAGYLSARQLKAASVLDLVAAGFTVKQAELIVTEAEKL